MRIARRSAAWVAALWLVPLVSAAPARADVWTQVSLTISQLFILNAGEGHYEGWLVRAGQWYTLGKFNTDSEGINMRSYPGDNPITFLAAPGDLLDADSMIVTVEPDGDAEPGPNRSRVLAGGFTAGTATLRPTDPRALGRGFGPDSISASYMLDTPSDLVNSNWKSGVWYYDRHGVSDPAQWTRSMLLPILPAGWKYEAWIGSTLSSDPIPYSCGEFYTPDGADSDGCGGGAGTGGFCPNFPGQDFLVQNLQQNHLGDPIAPTLTDTHWGITISIEPDPNTGPNPFHSLEPLNLAQIAPTALQYQLKLINNTSTNFPVVTASLATAPVSPTSWGGIKQLYR